MRISDWTSDVCSSDLLVVEFAGKHGYARAGFVVGRVPAMPVKKRHLEHREEIGGGIARVLEERFHRGLRRLDRHGTRSEEHTSELQSLMRISYAVFCLKKKKKDTLNA